MEDLRIRQIKNLREENYKLTNESFNKTKKIASLEYEIEKLKQDLSYERSVRNRIYTSVNEPAPWWV